MNIHEPCGCHVVTDYITNSMAKNYIAETYVSRRLVNARTRSCPAPADRPAVWQAKCFIIIAGRKRTSVRHKRTSVRHKRTSGGQDVRHKRTSGGHKRTSG